MDTILIGGLLRALQACFMCAPTLLVGLFIAALLRYFLAIDGTRKLFGGETLRSLPQSWLIGMLLPVCSIGVLPILREMKRANIRPGAMTAFALAAPLFNPLSLLYGLTLSRPIVIIGFVMGSLIVVTALGMVWDYLQRKQPQHQTTATQVDAGVSYGVKRLAACFVFVCREFVGPSGLLTLTALLGLWLLGSLLPHGALQTSVEQKDPLAPLLMAIVGMPIYSTPMLIMSQLGMMFGHGNSPGAAFCLLTLGAGMNVATVVWIAQNYGWRQTGLWCVALFVIVLGCAYAIDRPLIPPGVEPAGHTHAFDIYTNPLHRGQQYSWQMLTDIVLESSDLASIMCLRILGFLFVCGVVLRLLGSQSFIDRWITPRNDVQDKLVYDRIVSPYLVGIASLIGVIAFSVVGCYAYYPQTEVSLKELQAVKAEALGHTISGDPAVGLQWIPVWEDWSRKLEVGTFIREFELRPYQRAQAALLRKQLELLEHELEHVAHEMDSFPKDGPKYGEHQEHIEMLVGKLSQTSQRLSQSFRSGSAQAFR
jgi:uncharacterized protein